MNIDFHAIFINDLNWQLAVEIMLRAVASFTLLLIFTTTNREEGCGPTITFSSGHHYWVRAGSGRSDVQSGSCNSTGPSGVCRRVGHLSV